MLMQIAVISFDDEVDFATGDKCYAKGLGLVTPANKEKLTQEFVALIQPTGTKANFSNAFMEAFRLLSNADSTQPTESTRGQ